MMKYAIITPTYKKHFKFIPKYLESFDKFVEDKSDIPIYFTIAKSENNVFQKIIKKYKKGLNLNVLFIEDLFEENNISFTPDEYLKQFGRFTFQTAKKFYSMSHVDAEKFLVLDCESMWIKPTNMTRLFDNYFASPFIVTSKIEDENRKNKNFNQMLENILYLTDGKKKWYIESYMWYYDKQILTDMFTQFGNLNALLNKLTKNNNNLDCIIDIKYGIFEIVLYYAYLDLNKGKYGYREIPVDNFLKEYIPNNELKIYKTNFYNYFNSCCGIIEHSLIFLNEYNIKALASMFKAIGLNIIRCEKSDIENFDLQKRFIDIVQPNILAASQEHAFGINDRYKTLIADNKYTAKVIKHWSRLINPTIKPLQWFLEPFSLTLYCIKWIIKRQSNIKKYNERYGKTK